MPSRAAPDRASFRGLWHLSQYTPDNDTLAEKFFQEATDLDPAFSGAYGGLAMAQGQAPDLHSPGQPETTNSVEALVRRAIALDGADAEARSLLSNALWRRADFEGARAEAERALAMTPNLASAHDMLGATLIFSGRPKEGIAALEKSIRLDPREPRLAHRLNRLALGRYFTREYDRAQQRVGKFATDRGAYLCHLLDRRQPIETCCQ